MTLWFRAGQGLTRQSSIVSSDKRLQGKRDWRTVYDVKQVSSGKHEWKIKVIKGCSMLIGITSNTTNSDPNYPWNKDDTFCYGYYGYDGDKYNKDGYQSYGESYGSGDIIGVHVNFDLQTIEFSKNGKRQGIAYRNIQKGTTYRLTTTVGTYADKLKVISYQKEMSRQHIDQTLQSIAKHFAVSCKSHKRTYMELKHGESGRCHGCNNNIDETQYFFHCSQSHCNNKGRIYCIECAVKERKEREEGAHEMIESLKQQIESQRQNETKINEIMQALQSENQRLRETLRKYQESSSVYLLNKIQNYDEIDVEYKDDINEATYFQKYQNIFKHHKKILEEWNNNTAKLQDLASQIETGNDFNITESNDDEKKSEYNNHLYDTFIFRQKMIKEQSERLHNIATDHHIKQLISVQNQLSQQIEANQLDSEAIKERNGSLTNEYERTQHKRIKLMEEIEDNVNKCNEMIKRENQLSLQVKNEQHLINTLQKQQQKLQSSSVKCISLIDAYIEFEETNKAYIKTMNKYFQSKWRDFESIWWQWDDKDVVSWFMYKTNEMNTNHIKWNHIRNEMKKRNINGASLEHFNDYTLDMIGIHDFNVALYLMKEITTLRNRYWVNESHNEQNMKNDTEIPSKFICPITKQMMKHPVVAFDENNYEREAILQHLNEKGTSPITGKVAFRLHVFSNEQLKKEIEAYCTSNEIYDNEGQQDDGDTIYI